MTSGRGILLLGLLLAALVAGGFLLLRDGNRAQPATLREREPVAPLAQPPAADPEPATDLRERAEDDRQILPEAAAGTRTEQMPRPSDRPALTLTLRVLDPTGQPLAGVPIRTSLGKDTVAVSDGAGVCSIELAAGAAQVELLVNDEDAGGRFATVRSSWVTRGSAALEHLLVAARAVSMGGRVVDAGGLELEGVVVRSRLDAELLTEFPHALDRSSAPLVETRTAADGSFRLEPVPVVAGHAVSVLHPGFVPGRVAVPPLDRVDLVVVLERGETEDRPLFGHVLLFDRMPAAGARVRLEDAEATADEAGAFALTLPRKLAPEAILAAGLAGTRPAWIERFGEVVAQAAPALPAPVELVLGQALDLAGRVEDPDGNGLPGWRVAVRDGVNLGKGMIPPETAETLAGYADVETDPDGRFTLVGLAAREYRPWAYDPRTLQTAESSEPVPAGTRDLRLVALGEELGTLAGIVTSRRGRPLAGVGVGLSLVTHRTEFGWSSVGGQVSATTDGEGRFRLERVPREGVLLSLSGDHVVPRTIELDGASLADMGGPRSLRVEVAQGCHFRVEVVRPPAEELVRFELLDDSDTQLPIYAFQANGWSSSSSRAVGADGRTTVLAVSEDARTLLLKKPGGEDVRHPIALEPDGVNQLRVELE